MRWLLTLALLLVPAPALAQTAVARARAALDAVDVATCVDGTALAAASEVRLAIVVHTDGAWALAVGPIAGDSAPDDAVAALRACVQQALATLLPGVLPRPPPSARAITRSWRPPPPPSTAVATPRGEPRPDGREGAICRWGEHRDDVMTLPEPAPCRRGLTCCSAGGAWGVDSVCMRVSGCPAYP